MRISALVVILVSTSSFYSLANASVNTSSDPQQHPLVSWLLAQEGASFQSAKQEIKLETPDDSSSRYGVFATQDIQENEVLATIPWDLLITSEGDGQEEDAEEILDSHFRCATARNLGEQFRLGSKSDVYPYLQHLQSQSPQYNLPSQYSPRGADLFLDVLGGEYSNQLLMEHPAHYVTYDWVEVCGGSKKDELGATAAMLVQQHSIYDLMIPLKDFYTHRNGPFHNVHVIVKDTAYVRLVARRDIFSGEQLHTSYSECEGCLQDDNDDEENYGTPEMFRDHGIIEQFPQLWAICEGGRFLFPDTNKNGEELGGFMFGMDEVLGFVPYTNENGEEVAGIMLGIKMLFKLNENPETGKIDVDLLFEVSDPFLYSLIDALFRQKIAILHRLKNIDVPATAQEYGIPQHEWDGVWAFHDAYSMALKWVVVHLHDIMAEHGTQTVHGEEKFCRVPEQWEDHYTYFHVDGEVDHSVYNKRDCPSSEMVDFQTYQPYELERSNYQEMFWQYRPSDGDTCLHLDDMLQICSSYRPHYHEFFVHYPARYLKDVKRVIYLGSGDAMLLHEILKYPNLEKVVGMELDQTVTRKSFKHFKTQPHYDDPRVEWWYGDATKTLPLLPRDYWGSFDLLLVDLSETVVSLHVTGKHDVLDVISMLLKPEGVMLENELYMDKMSRHFDHTAHIFYGSPKVCVQVHTVSSNSVDFMSTPIQDHEIDMFLIDPVEKEADRFKYIHDYVKTNPITQGKCSDKNDQHDITITEHGRKGGIMIVLEAEDATFPLDDTASLLANIQRVLKETGLSPLNEHDREEPTAAVIQVVMKEGYVVARVWPELKYVAFDISFWGAYTRMEGVRTALAETVGSQATSSYRVVVGGMHGSLTWDQDQYDIGVQFSQKRNCTAPYHTTDQKPLNITEVMTVAVDESLDLLVEPTGLTVVVACGSEQEDDEDKACFVVDALGLSPQVDTIIPVWACDDIPDFNNGSHDFTSMYECEKKVIHQLVSMKNMYDLSIDAFVVDLSAPLSMLQIFISVWGDAEFRDEMFDQPYLIAMPYFKTMPRRKRFMDIVRKWAHGTVTTMADFLFKGSGDSTEAFGWRVLTFGDDQAVHSISEMETRLQTHLPNNYVKARLLEGGVKHTQSELALEQRIFRPEDYDYGPNAKQMAEQRPLGRQTIFQFELVEEGSIMPALDELTVALQRTLQEMKYIPTKQLSSLSGVGDGAIIKSVFDEGNLVLVWDGLDHVDINLFCFDESVDLADAFLNHFVEFLGGRLQRSLRDDQPRGVGRVVNFQVDIDRYNMAAIIH